MEVRERTDNFWKVFSVILLIIMVGLVGVIVWQGQGARPAFYEGRPTAKSHLASLAPSLKATEAGRYWVSDLAEGALPFVVNIQTKVKAQKHVSSQAQGGGQDPQEMLKRFHNMLPFEMPSDPDEQQQYDLPPQDMPEEDQTGVGSGFVVREDGYIVTNAHVVDGADEFEVTFPDGKKMPAKLVGKDDFKDIAVLKVEPKGKLPIAALGDSDTTRIGEPVIAIGSPLGISATVTAGIISSNNRSISDMQGMDEQTGGEDIRKPQHYLQTDAAINRGNSGGPLINSDGQVIGVNQAIARKDMLNPYTNDWIPIEGIGFAIPIDEVKDSIQQIVEHGSVKYPGISASIQDVKAYTDQFRGTDLKLDVKDGVYVVKVMIGGPADKAGIKAGDVIISIDGNKASTANDFIKMLNQHKVGERVTLRVARQGGKQQDDVSVVLEALDLSKQPK